MISIVIPLYNQAEYIEECLASIQVQTIYPSEVIVVDDGSTDGGGELAKKYACKVIRQVNKGLSSARNTGIMNAESDYVLFLDADDKLESHAIERIEQKIKDTSASIISGSFKTFGLAEQEIILMPHPVLEDFKTGNRIGSSSCVQRKALLSVGGFSPRMTKGYEDLHLWINLLTMGYEIETIQEVIWRYRIKGNSMIHNAQAHHDELMAQIYKDFPHFK